MTAPRDGRVTDFLERCLRAGRFPGVCAAWSGPPPGTITAVCRGIATVTGAHDVIVKPDTIWDLASLTKPLVVTTLALLMRREGLWDLDEPLRAVLPDADGSAVGERSLRSLLAHSAGLPAWSPVYALAHGRPDRALRAVLGVPLDSGQDERVEYSCLGFLLLGWALEHTSGTGLDELFRRRVARPLGLEVELGYSPRTLRAGEQAGGAVSPSVERELTRQWGSDPVSVPPCAVGLPDDGNARFLGGVAGNAGLFGTARAALRLVSEYLPGGGTLLTAEDAALATRRATLEAGGSHRALGWQLASTPGSSAGPGLDPSSFGHTGFTGVSIWADPVRHMVLGLFAHRHHPAHRGIDLHPVRRRYHCLVAG